MRRDILKELVKTREDSFLVAEESAALDVEYLLDRMLREENISQRELAERLGVSEARVSQLISADTNPTVKTLARIANALGRKLDVGMPPRFDRGQKLCPWPTSGRTCAQWEPEDDAGVPAPASGEVLVA